MKEAKTVIENLKSFCPKESKNKVLDNTALESDGTRVKEPNFVYECIPTV